jgi:hypothetical protein
MNPPTLRRHTGPALAVTGLVATTALGFIVGAVNSVAAVPVRPPTLPTVSATPSDAPGASQVPQGVSVVPTTLYRTAQVTSWRSSAVTVTAAPRTVTATRTAQATVTAERTVTATATQTVTTTAAPPALSTGSTP